MLIPIIYPNGKHDMVKDFILTKMIDNREIAKFKRRYGWVNIDSNKIRESRDLGSYNGPERRSGTDLEDIFQTSGSLITN